MRHISPAVRIATLAIAGSSLLGLAACGNDTAGPLTLDQVGASLADAGCTKPVETPAVGGGDHRDVGSTITYATAPVATGPHWEVWATGPLERHFYTTKDRPPLEVLTHNLEHGYTIVWYRSPNVAPEAYSHANLKVLASLFPVDGALENKVIVAPWTEDDDARVKASGTTAMWPKDKTIAISHWSGPADDPAAQTGTRMYCSSLSGSAIKKFMKEYPYSDAPEGFVP